MKSFSEHINIEKILVERRNKIKIFNENELINTINEEESARNNNLWDAYGDSAKISANILNAKDWIGLTFLKNKLKNSLDAENQTESTIAKLEISNLESKDDNSSKIKELEKKVKKLKDKLYYLQKGDERRDTIESAIDDYEEQLEKLGGGDESELQDLSKKLENKKIEELNNTLKRLKLVTDNIAKNNDLAKNLVTKERKNIQIKCADMLLAHKEKMSSDEVLKLQNKIAEFKKDKSNDTLSDADNITDDKIDLKNTPKEILNFFERVGKIKTKPTDDEIAKYNDDLQKLLVKFNIKKQESDAFKTQLSKIFKNVTPKVKGKPKVDEPNINEPKVIKSNEPEVEKYKDEVREIDDRITILLDEKEKFNNIVTKEKNNPSYTSKLSGIIKKISSIESQVKKLEKQADDLDEKIKKLSSL